VAEVPPELAAPELPDEIEVQQSVAVHVCHRHSRAVVIMDGLVVFRRIIDNVVFKANAAFLVTVGELKVVECPQAFRCIELFLPVDFQSAHRPRIKFVGVKDRVICRGLRWQTFLWKSNREHGKRCQAKRSKLFI
jgi:hypothetical protein